jgi:8-oxo-dGTP pyrophosphatase MutT (NUDIX family)
MTVAGDLHLVTAGLLRRAGRGLLVHRTPMRVWYPDCWDLPGGHVEDGETSEAALRRELLEELDVSAEIVGEPFAHLLGRDFRMDIWTIDQWSGEPIITAVEEHDALAWMNHHEMAGLTLADARLPALFEAALR